MNKHLLVEIRDWAVYVTLSKVWEDGKWDVLFTQKYPLSQNITSTDDVDLFWVKKIKEDLSLRFDIKTVTSYELMFNTSTKIVETEVVKYKKEGFNISYSKAEYKNELAIKHPDMNINDVAVLNVINKENESVVLYNYEMIQKKLLKQIESEFLSEEMEITKIISSVKTIKYGMQKMIEKEANDAIFNIEINNDFLLISFFRNKRIVFQKKKNIGLNIVFENISKKMNVTYKKAKDLFEAFGNIPPEAVVDNRIIYTSTDPVTNIRNIYDKKNLSTYITECINAIFSQFYNELESHKSLKPSIVFSGSITKLTGFEDYAKITLGTSKIVLFKEKVLGLKNDIALSQYGALEYISFRKQSNTDKIETEENTIKIFKQLKNRLIRFYNYI